MKKLLAITTLLALTTSASFAATTATLALQGVVPEVVSIEVVGTGNATLDLSTTATNLSVGTVTINSNSNAGYKLTITSANAGKLKRSGGSEVMSYSLNYGSLPVDLSTAGGVPLTNSSSSVVSVVEDLKISYTGVASTSMVEGAYQDTLTLDVVGI